MMSASSRRIGSRKRDDGLPKAILFDFGGTLDADGTPWRKRFYRLYLGEHVDMDPNRFDRAFYTADDALVARKLVNCSFREILLLQVTGVLEALNVRDAGLASRLCDRFLKDAVDKIHSNIPLLRALSRRFQLGIVANFYGNLERVCLDTGLAPLLSVAIDSACVGFSKPDPRIFQAALTRLHLDPSDAIFVGDSLPRDMEGARRLGMRHIWLAPAAGVARVPCCPGDLTIGSLEELQRVVP